MSTPVGTHIGLVMMIMGAKNMKLITAVVTVVPLRTSEIPVDTSKAIRPLSWVDSGDRGSRFRRIGAPPWLMVVAFGCFATRFWPVPLYRSAIADGDNYVWFLERI